MLGMYATMGATCGLSALVGQALLAAGGFRQWSWTAPAVGFAALLCIATAAVRLPGHGWTAAGALGLAGVVSLLALRGQVRWGPVAERAILVGAPLVALASVPFVLNGRFGPLGTVVADDLGFHLAWAETLAEEGTRAFSLVDQYTPGYPLAPESLAAALAEPFGGVLESYVGLIVAVPVITGLTAIAAMRDVAPGWQAVAALLVGMPYTAAAYFAQGLIKETVLALLLLGLALVLRDLPSPSLPRRGLAPGVLVAAAFLTFSYPGVVAAVAVAAASLGGRVLVAGLAEGRRRLSIPPVSLRAVAPPLLVACGLLGAAVLLEVGRVTEFEEAAGETGRRLGPGGNFFRQISPRMVFGVWFSSDFRLAPLEPVYSDVGSVLAIGLVLFAAVWWVRRRDASVPGAALALLAIALYTRETSAPYFSAKWLVAPAPLLMLMVVRATLAAVGRRPLRPLLGVGFFALAGWSTLLVVRAAPVGPTEHIDDLRALRPLLRTGPTLFLGRDNYLRWALLGVPLSSTHLYSGGEQAVPFQKRRKPGATRAGPFDFDSIEPSSLDRFRYVVNTRSEFRSLPSTTWRRIRRTRFYEVWERRGPTGKRALLAEGDFPGAPLDCRRPRDRRVVRDGGIAAVRDRTYVGPIERWRTDSGRPPVRDFVTRFAAPAGGETIAQPLLVSRGLLEVSVQYASPVDLDVRAGPLQSTVPASLEGTGQYWSAGTFRSPGGIVRVRITSRRLRRGSKPTPRGPIVGRVALTPVTRAIEMVPLGEACGRYVDWYVPRGRAKSLRTSRRARAPARRTAR